MKLFLALEARSGAEPESAVANLRPAAASSVAPTGRFLGTGASLGPWEYEGVRQTRRSVDTPPPFPVQQAHPPLPTATQEPIPTQMPSPQKPSPIADTPTSKPRPYPTANRVGGW